MKYAHFQAIMLSVMLFFFPDRQAQLQPNVTLSVLLPNKSAVCFQPLTHQGENKEDKPLPINPNEQLFVALRLQTFLSMFSQSKLYHFTNCTLVSADMLLFFSLVCIHLCTCFMRKEIVCVLCGHQAWKRIMGTTPKQKNACLVRMATKIPSLDPYPSKLDVQHKPLSKPKLRGPAVV